MRSLPIAAAALFAAGAAGAMPAYQFDDGTAQGWQVRVGDTGGAAYLGPTGAGFLDSSNHPASLSGDPIDNDGAANVFVSGSTAFASGETPVYSFISPDLSGESDWQDLDEISAQLAPGFIGNDSYSAALVLSIEDTTGGGAADRSFALASGVSLAFEAWTEVSATGVDSFLAGEGVDSYTTQNVIFNIFHDPFTFDGGDRNFVLDSVTRVQAAGDGTGGGPTSPIPLPAPLALLGAGLAALGLVARRRA